MSLGPGSRQSGTSGAAYKDRDKRAAAAVLRRTLPRGLSHGPIALVTNLPRFPQMIPRWAGCVLVIALWSPSAYAQQARPVIVPDEATCPRCAIVSEVVTVLGTPEGPGTLNGVPFILADGRGRYWALAHEGAPKVFDAQGRFLTSFDHGHGRHMAAMSAMNLPGDSVAFFEAHEGIVTIVTPELHPARTIRVPFQIISGVAMGWPAEAIISGAPPPGEGSGWPLHRASFAHSSLIMATHFGPDGAAADGRPVRTQILAPSRSGGAWAADADRYRIVLWNASGQQVKTLERRPEWFASVGARGLGTPTTPPAAGILAIHEDEQTGDLWVFARVPATTWRDAWRRPDSADRGGRATSRVDIGRLYATRIEVINPSTGRIVARGMLDGLAVGALPGGRAALWGIDPSRIARVHIVSLEIREP